MTFEQFTVDSAPRVYNHRQDVLISSSSTGTTIDNVDEGTVTTTGCFSNVGEGTVATDIADSFPYPYVYPELSPSHHHLWCCHDDVNPKYEMNTNSSTTELVSPVLATDATVHHGFTNSSTTELVAPDLVTDATVHNDLTHQIDNNTTAAAKMESPTVSSLVRHSTKPFPDHQINPEQILIVDEKTDYACKSLESQPTISNMPVCRVTLRDIVKDKSQPTKSTMPVCRVTNAGDVMPVVTKNRSVLCESNSTARNDTTGHATDNEEKDLCHRRHKLSPVKRPSEDSLLERTSQMDKRRRTSSGGYSIKSGHNLHERPSPAHSSTSTNTDQSDVDMVGATQTKGTCPTLTVKNVSASTGAVTYAVHMQNNLASNSAPTTKQINLIKKRLKTDLARIKIDTFKRKRVGVPKGTVSFPTVCKSEITGDVGIDQENTITYPEAFNVIPIRDLCALNQPPLDPDTVKIATSDFGEMLKTYAFTKIGDQDLDDVHLHTNHFQDLSVYHLVYGAVPNRYWFEAFNILKFLIENAEKEETTSLKRGGGTKGKHEKAVLFEGELEYLTYVYWQLTTQDLLTWKNDVPRRIQKTILTLCWGNLRENLKRYRNIEGCDDDGLKKARRALDMIQRYAAFGDPIHISAECMHAVRLNLDQFWNLINEEQRVLWQFFLKSAGVHHYLCTHTMLLLQKRYIDVDQMLRVRLGERTTFDGSIVKSVLYASTARNPTNILGNKCVLSTNIVHSLFERYTKSPREVTRGLVVCLDNLIHTLCRSCAAHIVSCGLHEYNVIDINQMAGFIQSKISYKKVNTTIRIITERTLIEKIKKLILSMTQFMLPGQGMLPLQKRRANKPTITSRAVFFFMTYVRFVMSSALSGLMATFKPTDFSGRVWSEKIKDAVDDWISTNCADVKDVDAWPMTNEPDVEVYDEAGTSLLVSFDEIYEADDNTDSDESEGRESDNEDILNELSDIAKPYPELPSADYPTVGKMKKSQVKKSRRNDEQYTSTALITNTTNKTTDTTAGDDTRNRSDKLNIPTNSRTTGGRRTMPFELTAGSKIRLCLCVLCGALKTSSLLSVRTDCSVACCTHCIRALNEQEDAESLRTEIRFRVEARYKSPILFKCINEKRALKEHLPRIIYAKDMARGTYNRLDPNYGMKLATGLGKRKLKSRTSK